MKKFLLFFFLIMVCLLGGLIVWFSHSFNAQAYRAKIIETLSQMTGREVKIAGDVALTWSPFPTLTISGLSIANQKSGTDPIMLNVEKIQAEIDWGSLLKESLVVKKVVLEKPSLLLERISKSETNFEFPHLFKIVPSIDTSFLDGQNNFSLKINNLEVKEGTFIYHNAIADEKITFKDVSGRGVIGSLLGPFSFLGHVTIGKQPMDVDLRLGKIESSQNLPVSIELTDVSSGTKITSAKGFFVHDTARTGEWLNLSGIISSKNSALFFQNIGIDNWPQGPITGSFTLKVNPSGSLLDSITLRFGKGDAATSFSFQYDKVERMEMPVMAVTNLDFEKWKSLVFSLAKTPFFNGISTRFKLLLKEIKVNSEVLSEGQAEGEMKEGLLSFSNLTMQLPQGSSIALRGLLNPKEQLLDADIQLQTSNLYGLMEWLWNQKIPFWPEQGLKNAHLVGHIVLQPKQISSDWALGMLGETQFSGTINISDLEKLLVQTKLEIKNLNLDAIHTFDVQELQERSLPNGNYLFDLKMRDVLLKNDYFKQVNLHAELNDDNLGIKELLLEKEENSFIKITGGVQNLGREELFFDKMKLDFETPNLKESILKTWTENTVLTPFRKAQGNLLYTGNLKKGNFETHLLLDKLEVQTKGEIENPLMAPLFYQTHVSLHTSDIQEVFSSMEGMKERFPDLTGKLSLSFMGNGTLSQLNMKELIADFEKQRLEGEMALDLKEKILQANLTANALNLDTIFPTFDVIQKNEFEPEISDKWQVSLQLQSSKLLYSGHQFNALQTQMDLKDQTLTIPNLSAVLPDGQAHLKINGKIILKNPIIAEGKISLEHFPMEDISFGDSFSLLNGTLTMSGDFTASGNSWSNFLKTLRGEGKLALEEVTLSGMDMDELAAFIQRALTQRQSGTSLDVQIRHALLNGKTKIPSVSGDFKVEEGIFTSSEMPATALEGKLFFRKLKKDFLNDLLDSTVSIILNAFPQFPSLEILVQENKPNFQIEAFKQALRQEIDSLQKQQKESEEKATQEEALTQQNSILSHAKKVLEIAENRMKEMKSSIVLNPSDEAEQLKQRAELTLDEVRDLVLRSELSPEQLVLLNEKTSLLEVQTQDVIDYLERQSVLRQREAVQKLPPLIKKRLAEMIQIYNQNPQSSVLAGLVERSKKEEEKIEGNLKMLSHTQDLNQSKNLILEIKDSFQKVQKALNYVRQFSSTSGMTSDVSGLITEGEI